MNRTTSLVAALALTAAPLAATATAYAGTPAQRAAYSVTIGVNDVSPVVGDTLKIKGAVSPAAPGQSVRLQVKYADQKAWKNLGSAKLTGTSKYKFKDEVGSVRERKYRVVKAASHGHAGRTSAAAKVTSYGWRSLTSLTPVANSGISEVNTTSMNGVAYPDSLLQYVYAGTPNPGTTGYNLNRDCLQLTGRAGLADSSPVAGTATVAIAADGVQKYSGAFGLTQSADVSIDLTDAFRVTVSSTSANGGLGALGSPMVLCSN